MVRGPLLNFCANSTILELSELVLRIIAMDDKADTEVWNKGLGMVPLCMWHYQDECSEMFMS